MPTPTNQEQNNYYAYALFAWNINATVTALRAQNANQPYPIALKSALRNFIESYKAHLQENAQSILQNIQDGGHVHVDIDEASFNEAFADLVGSLTIQLETYNPTRPVDTETYNPTMPPIDNPTTLDSILSDFGLGRRQLNNEQGAHGNDYNPTRPPFHFNGYNPTRPPLADGRRADDTGIIFTNGKPVPGSDLHVPGFNPIHFDHDEGRLPDYNPTRPPLHNPTKPIEVKGRRTDDQGIIFTNGKAGAVVPEGNGQEGAVVPEGSSSGIIFTNGEKVGIITTNGRLANVARFFGCA
jgi:hypothetical protein